jgi:hypothetical protein
MNTSEKEFEEACIYLFGRDDTTAVKDDGGLQKVPVRKNTVEILAVMQEKYPMDTFKFNEKEELVRFRRRRWEKVCTEHNNLSTKCKRCKIASVLALGGDAARKAMPNINPTLEYMKTEFPTYTFRLSNDRVQRLFGKVSWQIVCSHNLYPNACIICGGERLCAQHKKNLSACWECDKTLWCHQHNNVKYTCPICPGPGWCATHGTQKANCFKCDPARGCLTCQIKHRAKGSRYCVKCHPDYIAQNRRASKFSCKAQDALERELGIQFKHAHFDPITKKVVGTEYCHPNWVGKPIDGVFTYDGKLCAFEALGNYWHGHKSMHGPDGRDLNKTMQKTFKELFEKTQAILRKLSALSGMTIFYLWEFDYKKLAKGQPLWSIVRRFEGTLEC